jgi:predicted AlkP superfamily phosphohydrolase/phosphomutase
VDRKIKGPEQTVLIGLDGANLEAIKPLISEGRLPNFKRLIQEGTLCVNALAPYPTLTGSNWASIATGAWPGTHGVTDMSYHVTGEPLNWWHNGFTSDAVEAETIWEAVSRVNKRAVVLKYTGSWPPRNKGIVMIDGGGGRPFWGGSYLELSHSQIFSTREFPNGNVIKLDRAKGWKKLPESSLVPMEAVVDFVPESGRVPDFLRFKDENLRKGKRVRFFILVTASSGRGYDTVYLYAGKYILDALAVVKNGEWSPSFHCKFEIDGRIVRGGMRFKVLELSAKGDALTIYFSQVYPSDSFSQPTEVGAGLVKKFGAYINHPGYAEQSMGWFQDSPETFLELMEYQNRWLGQAGRALLESSSYDLMAMQCHCIDFANHLFVPRHGWDSKMRRENLRHLARCYESVDSMIGDILKGASKNAFVCVLSDHGATESPHTEVFVNPILEEAGLFVRDRSFKGSMPRPDYSKSHAVSERACNIYINLKGREPTGIVDPFKYESLRDKIIDILLRWRHPETGLNPFSMVVRKEDARILGLYDNIGRDIGDIVYALRPEYDHEHGRQLPTATCGVQSIKPLLIFKGPNVKEGFVLQRNAWLIDVVPTIASAMDWPVPTESEGAVLHQIFKGQTSSFPRPEFIRQQNKNKKYVQTKMKTGSRKEVQKAGRSIAKIPSETAEHERKEKFPETLEEMREELKRVRAEARRWKSAYEQYHRITHGN